MLSCVTLSTVLALGAAGRRRRPDMLVRGHTTSVVPVAEDAFLQVCIKGGELYV